MLANILATLFLVATARATAIEVQNCTQSEADNVVRALGLGLQCVDTVLQVHAGSIAFAGDSNTVLLERYFGTTSPEEFNAITDVFSHIHDKWNDQPYVCKGDIIEQVCGPNSGASAFTKVQPNVTGSSVGFQTQLIGFCPSFLDNINFDTPWPSHVMIHELAHATVDPPPGDLRLEPLGTCYGEKNSQQLAVWSKELAARNADNYAYYADHLCDAVLGNGVPAAEEDVDWSEQDWYLADEIEKTVLDTSPECLHQLVLAGNGLGAAWGQSGSCVRK
ncbi:uncharacterized protein RCC_06407 [Ramularia collo-cygni]|uniref:Lysine-specific metallo-endopeptidase domain-containing protein n=1 Tax=Ramularia collo-cygni TaxID=112498 RepID=A0A2D3VFH3_9PEZI|nr:uncharacterized protein RCC_06407 [Ramularia collo-cygni]CZT20549.1 uncharacterized protein RCC_06407 [Ramularia collo-cygni]